MTESPLIDRPYASSFLSSIERLFDRPYSQAARDELITFLLDHRRAAAQAVYTKVTDDDTRFLPTPKEIKRHFSEYSIDRRERDAERDRAEFDRGAKTMRDSGIGRLAFPIMAQVVSGELKGQALIDRVIEFQNKTGIDSSEYLSMLKKRDHTQPQRADIYG